MNSEKIKSITEEVLKYQDENGCWNVLKEGDKYYPEYNYYVPTYKSTLWTLILLADIQTEYHKNHFHKPLAAITDHLFDNFSFQINRLLMALLIFLQNTNDLMMAISRHPLLFHIVQIAVVTANIPAIGESSSF